MPRLHAHQPQELNALFALTHRECRSGELSLSRVAFMNDVDRRVFREQDVGKKLLVIGSMILVMGLLVWSIG